jgi:hypothetical protein
MITKLKTYRGFPIKFRGRGPIKNFLPASQDAGNGIALGTKPVFSIHKCLCIEKTGFVVC